MLLRERRWNPGDGAARSPVGREEVEKPSWLCTPVEVGAPRCPKAAPGVRLGEGGPSVPEPVTFLKMGHHLHYMSALCTGPVVSSLSRLHFSL